MSLRMRPRNQLKVPQSSQLQLPQLLMKKMSQSISTCYLTAFSNLLKVMVSNLSTRSWPATSVRLSSFLWTANRSKLCLTSSQTRAMSLRIFLTIFTPVASPKLSTVYSRSLSQTSMTISQPKSRRRNRKLWAPWLASSKAKERTRPWWMRPLSFKMSWNKSNSSRY